MLSSKGMHLDDAEIAAEVREIEDSLKVKQGGFELLTKNSNFRRVVGLGIGLQIIQQLTGINVIMYYAPEIFKMAGFADTNQQMWGTVIVGVTNGLATFIAIAFVDKLGRKPIMYAGLCHHGAGPHCRGHRFFVIGGESHSVTNAKGVVESAIVFEEPRLRLSRHLRPAYLYHRLRHERRPKSSGS